MSSDFKIKKHVLTHYRGREKHVIIPENVRKIGNSAFMNCTSIESIEISEDVTCIAKNAFFNCENLRTVKLPDSLKEIEDYAFEDCKNLEDINLSKKIKKMGMCVFPKNIRLKQFPDGFIILHHVLYQYLGTEKIIKIPEGVKQIAPYALTGKTKKTQMVIFPESIKKISSMAIDQHESPESIVLHQIQISLDREIHWFHAVKLIEMITEFLQNPDNDDARKFLQKNDKNLILYLEDQTFQKILDSGKIFDAQNIDDYIQYAIENQKYSRQMLLINYKYQHCDFRNIGEELKL